MDEISDFYKSQSHPLEFNIKQEITHVVELLSGKIKLMGVVIEQEIDETLVANSFKYAFANSIMVIIDNSIDMAKENKIGQPLITIEAKEYEKNILVIITDNSGGITQKPIESIFHPFVSSKENSSGLGLSISKMLVEQKLRV